MAKKTQFETLLERQPRRAEVTMTMDPDSTNEVSADIDTNIDDGQGWYIYGLEYDFENITPTVPVNPLPDGGSFGWQLQIHRNDDNAVMLNQHDNVVMLHHKMMWSLVTTGGNGPTAFPIKVPIETVTLQPTLRCLFRTDADLADISLSTIQLCVTVLYDIIAAPARLASKLGTLADL